MDLKVLRDEASVVYFAVEIRKLIEQTRNQNYTLLKFYCDWCVHSRKDKITKEIEIVMGQIYENICSTNGEQPELKDIQDFVEMEGLRSEVDCFLQEQGLPTDLVLSDNWERFINLMTQILVEQPIKNPTDKIASFSFVETASPNTAAVEIEYLIKPAEYKKFQLTRGTPVRSKLI